jgi:hypothetical protein
MKNRDLQQNFNGHNRKKAGKVQFHCMRFPDFGHTRDPDQASRLAHLDAEVLASGSNAPSANVKGRRVQGRQLIEQLPFVFNPPRTHGQPSISRSGQR